MYPRLEGLAQQRGEGRLRGAEEVHVGGGLGLPPEPDHDEAVQGSIHLETCPLFLNLSLLTQHILLLLKGSQHEAEEVQPCLVWSAHRDNRECHP